MVRYVLYASVSGVLQVEKCVLYYIFTMHDAKTQERLLLYRLSYIWKDKTLPFFMDVHDLFVFHLLLIQ